MLVSTLWRGQNAVPTLIGAARRTKPALGRNCDTKRNLATFAWQGFAAGEVERIKPFAPHPDPLTNPL